MIGRPAKAPKAGGGVRLLPAAMVSVAALLGLKAVAMAESVAETTTPAPADGAAAPPAGAAAADGAGAQTPPSEQCAAPSIAEMAGLSQTEVQVLQALTTRREVLETRAAQAETQDALMAAAEQRLTERLTELRQLESTVNELLGHLDEAQEQRLTGLVDVYQRMRAKDAANVFNGLNDDVLVQVASRMRQANLAEIMGKMTPERARALTQMLAERARPPQGGEELLQRANANNAR